MKTFAFASLALLTSAAPAAAAAGSTSLVEFRYKAPELASEDGRAAVMKRIRTTAASECRQGTPSWTIESCRNDLERQLVRAIGTPELLAMQRRPVAEVAMRGD